MNTLVLEIRLGGLGDHLFYSHLPRIAKESHRYDKVLVSNRSIFRHPDYKKFVWELNPYVDGFTDEKGSFFLAKKVGKNENLLDRIMLLYGLDDGLRFHEPEIYYQPLLNPSLVDAIVYDPNYVSYIGDLSGNHLIENWLAENNISVNYQMRKLKNRSIVIDCDNYLDTPSLTEFCSVIASCKSMYCLTTGTATLAAALKKPVTAFHGNGQPEIFHHSKLHRYINLGSDYRIKNKIKKQIILLLGRFFQLGPR